MIFGIILPILDLEKSREVETIKVSEELCIDLSPDGKVYGIELLNANEQLRREN